MAISSLRRTRIIALSAAVAMTFTGVQALPPSPHNPIALAAYAQDVSPPQVQNSLVDTYAESTLLDLSLLRSLIQGEDNFETLRVGHARQDWDTRADNGQAATTGNLDLTLLEGINIPLGGALSIPLVDAGNGIGLLKISESGAGVLSARAHAEAQTSAKASTHAVSNDGFVNLDYQTGDPAMLTLNLADLLGDETLDPLIEDLKLSVGAAGSAATKVNGAYTSDYKIADVQLLGQITLLRALSDALLGDDPQNAIIDQTIEGIVAESGLVHGITTTLETGLRPLGVQLTEGGAGIDVESYIGAAVNEVLTTPLYDGATPETSLVVLNLAEGTVMVNLDRLHAGEGLNNLDPNTKVVTQRELTLITDTVNTLLTGPNGVTNLVNHAIRSTLMDTYVEIPVSLSLNTRDLLRNAPGGVVELLAEALGLTIPRLGLLSGLIDLVVLALPPNLRTTIDVNVTIKGTLTELTSYDPANPPITVEIITPIENGPVSELLNGLINGAITPILGETLETVTRTALGDPSRPGILTAIDGQTEQIISPAVEEIADVLGLVLEAVVGPETGILDLTANAQTNPMGASGVPLDTSAEFNVTALKLDLLDFGANNGTVSLPVGTSAILAPDVAQALLSYEPVVGAATTTLVANPTLNMEIPAGTVFSGELEGYAAVDSLDALVPGTFYVDPATGSVHVNPKAEDAEKSLTVTVTATYPEGITPGTETFEATFVVVTPQAATHDATYGPAQGTAWEIATIPAPTFELPLAVDEVPTFAIDAPLSEGYNPVDSKDAVVNPGDIYIDPTNGEITVIPLAEGELTIPVTISFPDGSVQEETPVLSVGSMADRHSFVYGEAAGKPNATVVSDQVATQPEGTTFALNADTLPAGYTIVDTVDQVGPGQVHIDPNTGAITVGALGAEDVNLEFGVIATYVDGSSNETTATVHIGNLLASEYPFTYGSVDSPIGVSTVNEPVDLNLDVVQSIDVDAAELTGSVNPYERVGSATDMQPGQFHVDPDTGVVTVVPRLEDATLALEVSVPVVYNDGSHLTQIAQFMVPDTIANSVTPYYETVAASPGESVTNPALLGEGEDHPENISFEATVEGYEQVFSPDDLTQGQVYVNPANGEVTIVPRWEDAGKELAVGVVATFTDGSTIGPVYATFTVGDNDAAEAEPTYAPTVGYPKQPVEIAAPEGLPEGATLSATVPEGFVEKTSADEVTEPGDFYFDEATGVIVLIPRTEDGNQTISVPVRVTYTDGSYDDIEATVVVGEEAQSYNPTYEIQRVVPGDPAFFEAPDYAGEVPTGATYALGENLPEGFIGVDYAENPGEISIDPETGAIRAFPTPDNPTGFFYLPVAVTYEDGSVDRIDAIVIAQSSTANVDFQIAETQASPVVKVTTGPAAFTRGADGEDIALPNDVTFGAGFVPGYTEVDSADAVTEAGQFYIDPNTGEITMIPRLTSANSTIVIPVIATFVDGSTLTRTANIVVGPNQAANNQPEYPAESPATPGQSVTVPQSADLPEGTTFDMESLAGYTVVEEATEPGYMSIDPATGDITLIIREDNPDEVQLIPVTVTYPDGSVDRLLVPVNIGNIAEVTDPSYPEGTEVKQGEAVEVAIELPEGQELSDGTTFEVPEGTEHVTVAEDGTITVTAPVDHPAGEPITGVIVVTYPDQSTDEVPFSVDVVLKDNIVSSVEMPEDVTVAEGEAIAPISIEAEGNDPQITVEGLPNGLTFADGQITGTPVVNDWAEDETSREFTVTVTVTDEQDEDIVDSFIITVERIVAPVWGEGVETTPGAEVVVPNEGGDIVDGTVVELADGSAPAEVSIDPETGDITVTPSEDAEPGSTVVVEVKDPEGNVIDTIEVEIVAEEETDPVTPVDPTDPETPVDPTDPVIPVDPTDPVDPIAPVWGEGVETTPGAEVVVPNEGGDIVDGTGVELADGSAPAEVSIDPATGDITVTPSEDAEPGSTVVVEVKDPEGNVIDTIEVEIVAEEETDPVTPVDPTDPETPEDPTDPEIPVDPTDPETPEDPTDPVDPIAPVWGEGVETTPGAEVVVPNEGGDIVDGTVVELADGSAPAEVSIDPETGDITVTPSEDAEPGSTVVVEVKDPEGKVIDTIEVEIVAKEETDPVTPVDPTDPETPEDPTDPEIPVDPTDPETPEDPTDPVDPIAPVWGEGVETTPGAEVVVPNEGGDIVDGTGVELGDGSAPAEVSIDPETGDITVTPSEDAEPGSTVVVEVKDPEGNVVDSFEVNITEPIVVDPETPAWPGTVEVTPGIEVVIPNDGGEIADGTGVELGDGSAPAEVSIDPETGDITVIPSEDAEPGSTVVVEVKDPEGNVIDTIEIIVAQPEVVDPAQTPAWPGTVEVTPGGEVVIPNDGGPIDEGTDASLAEGSAPAEVSIDPVTGDVTVTPSEDAEPGSIVVVEVKDPEGTIIDTIEIIIVDDQPVDPAELPAWAGAVDAVAGVGVVVPNVGGEIADGTVVQLGEGSAPAEVSIDPVTGAITVVPSLEAEPGSTVVVNIVDTDGHIIDSIAVTVLAPVVNPAEAPAWAGAVDAAAGVGVVVPNVGGQIADGTSVVLAEGSAPAEVSIDPATGAITVVPSLEAEPGSTVVVNIVDADGHILDSIVVTVAEGNEAVEETKPSFGTQLDRCFGSSAGLSNPLLWLIPVGVLTAVPLPQAVQQQLAATSARIGQQVDGLVARLGLNNLMPRFTVPAELNINTYLTPAQQRQALGAGLAAVGIIATALYWQSCAHNSGEESSS